MLRLLLTPAQAFARGLAAGERWVKTANPQEPDVHVIASQLVDEWQRGFDTARRRAP